MPPNSQIADAPARPMTIVEQQIRRRMGMLPNFFGAATTMPGGPIADLWDFALTCYIDNPLPPLFKERLFVHLSRACCAKYCLVRHVGFLIGQGTVAGDPRVPSETIESVCALLELPPPGDHAAEAAAIERLKGAGPVRAELPPGSAEEAALFAAAGQVFTRPSGSAAAQAALSQALGPERMSYLIVLLAFITTAHFCSQAHPALEIEDDMLATLRAYPRLAALVGL